MNLIGDQAAMKMNPRNIVSRRSAKAAFIISVCLAIGLFLESSSPSPAHKPISRSELLGGQASIYNTTPNAFGQPIPGLEREQGLLFFVGNSFFNQNWITAPASTTARNGLGPMFNARSCASCHFKDGRGRPPEFDGESPTGFLIRLSMRDRSLDGLNLPEPTYGGQFQEMALEGIDGEGDLILRYESISGAFADGSPYELRRPIYSFDNLAYGDMHPEVMTSPRVASQVIGLGLLESIPEERLLELADPNDADKDGISGRPNYVRDHYNSQLAIGRFGWKANQPHLLQQAASAFHADIGITTSLFPHQNCSQAQDECRQAINGGEPEIVDDDLLKVVLYLSSLAVPAQRDFDDEAVVQGERVFNQLECNSCHIATHKTGIHPTIPALSNQTIHPFTDLLLHDMGEGLADNRPDSQATGTEWRTPPLWGIGMFETVNKHSYYLHDGRARNLTEAILWHGGEAEASRNGFAELSASDRAALIAFLKSL